MSDVKQIALRYRAIADEAIAMCKEQAAELTRLRARVEAAGKLAEAASPYVSPFQNGDYARQLRQHSALVAALSAYEGTK